MNLFVDYCCKALRLQTVLYSLTGHIYDAIHPLHHRASHSGGGVQEPFEDSSGFVQPLPPVEVHSG